MRRILASCVPVVWLSFSVVACSYAPDTPQPDAGPEPWEPLADAGSEPTAPTPEDASMPPRDGSIPESCTSGETRTCFEAAASQIGVGICRAGSRLCVGGAEFGTFGPCEGQVLPDVQGCEGLDEDCDGEIDEGCAPPPPVYGPWGPSSACSAECGGGTQSRSRECLSSEGAPLGCEACGGECIEEISCNAAACPLPPTTCGGMTEWTQCATASYVPGVHGDHSGTDACARSCGLQGAGCAKLILYPSSSSVCVCHSVSGTETSTGPFAPGNRSGNRIWAGDCF